VIPLGGKMKKMFQMYNLIFFLFFQTKENGRTFSIKITRGGGGGVEGCLNGGGGGGGGFPSYKLQVNLFLIVMI
jgi:hypothetical protein